MKKISILIAVMVLGAVSCSKWTEPEALEYETPTPAQQDKAGYEAYLKALRDYKRSNHKIVMVTMPGMSEKPTRQAQHISTAPDYADYICVYNAENLHPVLVKEIAEVSAQKSTQILCVADYKTIENEWNDYLLSLEGVAEEEMPTADDFEEYCAMRTQAMLDCCDAYGFSGVLVSYAGASSELLQSGQAGFFECVQRWRRTHRTRNMVLRGVALNSILSDYRSLIYDARYIVLWDENGDNGVFYKTFIPDLIMQLSRVGEELPADRIIIETAMPTLAEPAQVGIDAKSAAEWVASDEETTYTRAGLYMSNIQDDYFNTDGLYNNVRTAAEIMNRNIPQF